MSQDAAGRNPFAGRHIASKWKDPDPRQTREYLRLVAHENARLSRLIENFLTFSRLERGKQHYTFAAVEPGDAATEAMQERLTADDCQFDGASSRDCRRCCARTSTRW